MYRVVVVFPLDFYIALFVGKRLQMNEADSMLKQSIFLENIHHAYAQTDGTYNFPNNREGDMLKQAKKEIECLIKKGE